MGGAIAKGLLEAGGAELTVSGPHVEKLAAYRDLGASATCDNASAAAWADLVVTAVEPAATLGVLAEIAGAVKDWAEVAVVSAGTTLGQARSALGRRGAGLAMAMPNTAVGVRAGVTFLCGAAPLAVRVFATLGAVYEVPEALFPAGMALASCGLAFALRYVRAAAEGGVELGFDAATAASVVARTMQGAAALVEATGLHPEALIDQVTTPGGVTIRGLNAMERAGFSPSVTAGLLAAKTHKP